MEIMISGNILSSGIRLIIDYRTGKFSNNSAYSQGSKLKPNSFPELLHSRQSSIILIINLKGVYELLIWSSHNTYYFGRIGRKF